MFICPNCNKEFATEEEIKKHTMPCWRRHNPNYKSKEAPQGETVVTKSVNSDIMNFFDSFRKA